MPSRREGAPRTGPACRAAIATVRVAAIATALVALAAILLGCARRPAVRVVPAGGVVPLYSLGTSHVFVEVALSAHPGEAARRVLLLVDTGARNSALDLDVAERLGLEVTETGAESTGALGTQPVRLTTVWRLELPGVVTLERWPIKVLQITLGLDGDGALPVAGVLGTDLLERFDVLLDFPAGVARLGPAGSGPGPPPGATIVPFDWSRREILVTLRAPGSPERFSVEIDSGAELMLLFRRGAGFPAGRRSELVVGGAGEAERLLITEVTTLTLPEVDLGGLRLEHLDVVIWSGPVRAKDGLAGMAVLARHAVHLDFRAHRVAFGPARPPAPGPADYRPVLEKRLGRALAANADDYDANLALGMLRLMQERYDEARRLLGWASTLRPDEAEPLYRLALAEWGAGDQPAALDAAARAAGLVRGSRLYDRLVRALVSELAAARTRPSARRAEMLELDVGVATD